MEALPTLILAGLLALLAGAPWAQRGSRPLAALLGAAVAGTVSHLLLAAPATTLVGKLLGGVLGAMGPGAGSGGRAPALGEGFRDPAADAGHGVSASY